MTNLLPVLSAHRQVNSGKSAEIQPGVEVEELLREESVEGVESVEGEEGRKLETAAVEAIVQAGMIAARRMAEEVSGQESGHVSAVAATDVETAVPAVDEAVPAASREDASDVKVVVVDVECTDEAMWRRRLESRGSVDRGTERGHKPCSWEQLQGILQRYGVVYEFQQFLHGNLVGRNGV